MLVSLSMHWRLGPLGLQWNIVLNTHLFLDFQYNDQLQENERLRKVINDLKEGADHCDKSNHQGCLPDDEE